MFGFLHGGTIGEFLAPVVPPIERLFTQLRQKQPQLALELLQTAMGVDDSLNVNQSQRDGNYPIHLAARHGYAAVVAQLILLGADIDSRGAYPSQPTALLLAAVYCR